MTALTWLGASSWSFAAWTVAWGTLLTRRQLRSESPAPGAAAALPPVSILKPLKGADSGIRENLESFFALDYPEYELLFSVADARDPAVPLVRELMAAHPKVAARLIIGAVALGPNPKVNNLMTSYEAARHDALLIADSNVRVPVDYLQRLLPRLGPETGVVTSIVGGRGARGLGGHLEATYLNTFYARGMRLAFWVGRPTVVGKSMLFRRSTLQRFGGMRTLARYLAEDYMTGEAVRQLGLEVALMSDPIPQHIGEYSFRDFWSRHLRWGRMRKAQAPVLFLLEPLTTSMVSGALGAGALSHSLGVPAAGFFAAHLAAWAACDLALMRRLGQRLAPSLALTWLLRELLHMPLWLQTASGNTVLWRGRRMRLRPGGMVEAAEPERAR